MKQEGIVPRFYGSETEYSYTVDIGKSVHISPTRYPKVAHFAQYLENGGRLYKDAGDVLEYATPECKKIEELVVHEIAGEQLVWEAYGNPDTRINTLHKRSLSPVHGRKDGDIKSFGAHENYSTTVDVRVGGAERYKDVLASHFATRTIFIGAGKSMNDTFAIGQKVLDLTQVEGLGTTASKALVNTRDEPHGGCDEKSPLKRLHVTSGDANISPWAIRMKFGTTSLVLRLLEDENLSYLKDVRLHNPLTSAKKVARSIEGMIFPLLLSSGKTATALNIQEIFIEKAETLSRNQDLPAEEVEVLKEWQSAVNALRKYHETGESQPEMNQMDWYAKKRIIEMKNEKNGGISVYQRESYDLLYDAIPQGYGVKLRDRTFATFTPKEEQVEHAKTTPPEGRAKLRGEFARALYENKCESNFKSFAINWDRVTLEGQMADFGDVLSDFSNEEIAQKVHEFLMPVLRRKQAES